MSLPHRRAQRGPNVSTHADYSLVLSKCAIKLAVISIANTKNKKHRFQVSVRTCTPASRVTSRTRLGFPICTKRVKG